MLFAIEAGGRTVALTQETDAVTRLNTDRLLQDTVRHLQRGGHPLWDGRSAFTARPATEAETGDYLKSMLAVQ